MASEPPDYYAILGVAETATQAEIKDARKRLSLAFHPDKLSALKAQLAPEALQLLENRYKAINDAYDHLSTPAVRAQYEKERRPAREDVAKRGDLLARLDADLTARRWEDADRTATEYR